MIANLFFHPVCLAVSNVHVSKVTLLHGSCRCSPFPLAKTFGPTVMHGVRRKALTGTSTATLACSNTCAHDVCMHASLSHAYLCVSSLEHH